MRNRLSNAFQLITADNGWLMGYHRIVGKSHAYATPVPMYVRWPRQLRGHARTVRDKVAIVDLPRTFCVLAGCSMPRQDGRNLLPLIKGRKQRLDRSFLATEMLHAARDYGERRMPGLPGPASRRPSSTTTACGPTRATRPVRKSSTT